MAVVELPPAVTALGLKAAVAPAGSPLALKVTVCADPLTTAVAMVDVTVCPCGVVTLLGLALIEKSSEAGAVAARAVVVAWVGRAPVPVAVIGEFPARGEGAVAVGEVAG